MNTCSSPYPPQLMRSLWDRFADRDWCPDELNEPLCGLQVQIAGRLISFNEHVDFTRRTISLAVWPGWSEDLGILGVFAMLFEVATPTVLQVALNTEGTFSLWVKGERKPRLATRDEYEIRDALHDLVGAI